MPHTPFDAMLILLVPTVIKEIAANDGSSPADAAHAFYASDLYAALERDETKLWNLSSKALYQLYHEEQTTGEIHYPEEA